MFLDYDRGGFPYPVVAFQVNCYGRRVIAQRGYRSSLEHPLAEADVGSAGRVLSVRNACDQLEEASEPCARGSSRIRPRGAAPTSMQRFGVARRSRSASASGCSRLLR